MAAPATGAPTRSALIIRLNSPGSMIINDSHMAMTISGAILGGSHTDSSRMPVSMSIALNRAYECDLRAKWRWVEVGVQHVAVTLDGAPVVGSPFAIYVRSAPLHAPACLLLGIDDAHAPAASPTGVLSANLSSSVQVPNRLHLLL